MFHVSFFPSFWHHALAMATYLVNILPSKVLDYQTPLKILYNRDPIYSHLRVFGCLCYPLFPSTTIHKLQARSTPCVFLGYPSNQRGYKCYDLFSHKIIINRHVIFYDSHFPFATLHKPTHSTYNFFDEGISPYVLHQLAQPAPIAHLNASPTGHLTWALVILLVSPSFTRWISPARLYQAPIFPLMSWLAMLRPRLIFLILLPSQRPIRLLLLPLLH